MSLASRLSAVVTALRGKSPVGTVTSADFGRERGWFSMSGDGPMLGSFQRDIHWRREEITANWAWFACSTLIANDIAKLHLRLVERAAGTWQETESPAFSPVLRKPNSFQTRQQFIAFWQLALSQHGNTYVLKERDDRQVVVALYVLDPRLVKPMVTPMGEVFYRLHADNLAGVREDEVMVPASEIIHDRENCLFHPLCGIAAIYACGLAAMQGLMIQRNAATFFQNMSRPSGILTAPGELTDDLAKAYRARWNENYGGHKVGQVAVLGNGLSYSAITANAVDSQLVEQLKVTAEMVCSTMHVPAFKIGAGVIPAGQKVEDLNQIYYSDCLQARMEAIENLLDEGLGLDVPIAGRRLGTEFDLGDLLKMDSLSQATLIDTLTKAGVMKPNEGRARFGLLPVKGGDTPYLQQQNYALAALAKRDSGADPFGTAAPPAPAAAPMPAAPPESKALEQIAAKIDRHIEETGAKQADLFAELRTAKEAQADSAEQLLAHEFVAELVKRFDAESVL